MKSRQRFFDLAVLRKDLLRFAPAWALYLIGGIMIATSSMSYRGMFSAVAFLNSILGPFGILNMIYAMIVAQLLFGDLYKARLCNALHAMPLQREGWFLTHVAAGILMSLVPNFLIGLTTMGWLDQYWYAGLLWLLGMEMEYLFFFGLAVFSVQCTGNRFASLLVYCILNFLSMLVLWFAQSMYEPLLYGVQVDSTSFLPFCPVAKLATSNDFFQVLHFSSCPCLDEVGNYYHAYYYTSYPGRHHTAWGGMGAAWGYLGILVGLGVVLLAVALLLYRRRNLECAGDFVAFRWLRPVFWVLFALCAGGAAQVVGYLFFDVESSGGYIFLVIGIIVGYFVGKMLLARNIKVFKPRAFLELAALLVAFGLSLGITALDPVGITRYVPQQEQVETVYVIPYRETMEDFTAQVERSNALPRRWFVSSSAADIRKITDIHEDLIELGSGSGWHQKTYTIVYLLKDGRYILRCYTPSSGSEAVWELENKMPS